MATLVGTQTKFEDAVCELLELEYNTIETYESAIKRLDNQEYKEKLREFCNDSKRHVANLTTLIRQHHLTPPSGPTVTKIVTKGKVVMANIMGDNAILKVVHSNEVDGVTAYGRVASHEGKWANADKILNDNFREQQNHKRWIESKIS